jgi:predicted  nucleic acid-binding Zn-ribbon protein
MNETLLKLNKLQKIDSEILERQSMIEQIPHKIEELKEGLQEKEESLEDVKRRLQQNHNMELAMDKQLQETRIKITKHKKQLLSVKTNKEYAALLREISLEESNIERLEEEMLGLMEETEEIKEEKREEERLLQKMRENYNEKKGILNDKKDKFEKEIKEKREKREKIAEELNPDLLKKYERIKKSRDGLAVVRIQGETCGGCFSSIPPQLINEAKVGDKIITCGSCGRILIYIEEDETFEK